MSRIEKMILLRKQGKLLKEIGSRFHLSTERIRQLIGYIKPPPKYPIGFKRCYQCKKTLPISNFYKSKSKTSTTNNRCILCLKINSNKWMKLYQYKYHVGGKYYLHSLARAALYNATKRNKIIKPSVCEINIDCSKRIEGHHYLGYDKSNYLNVRWLCSKHHKLADKGLI
jgi:hypothetical protein